MHDKNWSRYSDLQKRGCLSCPCEHGIQDMKHILMECWLVVDLVDKAISELRSLARDECAAPYNLQTDTRHLTIMSFLNMPFISGGLHDDWTCRVGRVFYDLLEGIQDRLQIQSVENILSTEPAAL